MLALKSYPIISSLITNASNVYRCREILNDITLTNSNIDAYYKNIIQSNKYMNYK